MRREPVSAGILAFTDEGNIVCLDEHRVVGDTLSAGAESAIKE